MDSVSSVQDLVCHETMDQSGGGQPPHDSSHPRMIPQQSTSALAQPSLSLREYADMQCFSGNFNLLNYFFPVLYLLEDELKSAMILLVNNPSPNPDCNLMILALYLAISSVAQRVIHMCNSYDVDLSVLCESDQPDRQSYIHFLPEYHDYIPLMCNLLLLSSSCSTLRAFESRDL